jgi:hypothetical protein
MVARMKGEECECLGFEAESWVGSWFLFGNFIEIRVLWRSDATNQKVKQ